MFIFIGKLHMHLVNFEPIIIIIKESMTLYRIEQQKKKTHDRPWLVSLIYIVNPKIFRLRLGFVVVVVVL